jgi:hypothetical protein
MSGREQVLAAYERAWQHDDETKIRAELEHCWTPTSTHVSPLSGVVHGIEGMLNLILDYPVMFPGAHLQMTSPPDTHHEFAYYTWKLTSTTRIRMMGRNYGRSLDGVDFVEFDDGGQIKRITSFFGADQSLTGNDQTAPVAHIDLPGSTEGQVQPA